MWNVGPRDPRAAWILSPRSLSRQRFDDGRRAWRLLGKAVSWCVRGICPSFCTGLPKVLLEEGSLNHVVILNLIWSAFLDEGLLEGLGTTAATYAQLLCVPDTCSGFWLCSVLLPFKRASQHFPSGSSSKQYSVLTNLQVFTSAAKFPAYGLCLKILTNSRCRSCFALPPLYLEKGLGREFQRSLVASPGHFVEEWRGRRLRSCLALLWLAGRLQGGYRRA